MTTFSIRPPAVSDVPRLHDLIREHAVFEGGAALLTAAELESLLREQGEAVRFLVAADRDHLVGYATVTFDWSVWRARRYAHLDCLFVTSMKRGQGIGKCLFDEAQAVACAEGVDRMEWQTPAWNEDATRFYLREGAAYVAKSRFSLFIPGHARAHR